jgi:PiT family inorganic phosphate transporter
MAWAIGAGSTGSTPFAPAVGANAIGVLRAALLVGVLGLAGALLQGGSVTEAVGRELVIGQAIPPLAAALALSAAAILVAIGVFAGYPIATAFTVTGAVVGAGLALGGDPNWPKYAQIGALWVGTPFLGGGAAYGIARLLRADGVPERWLIPSLGGVLGLTLAHLRFDLLGSPGERGSLARWTAWKLDLDPSLGMPLATAAAALTVGALVYATVRSDPRQGARRFVVALGALVAFSAGGSQVGLAAGPMLPVVEGTVIEPMHVIGVAGGAMLLGSWTGAPRMIKAVAQDYGSLGPRRSIAALLPSYLIAQTAVLFGIPISFNEIVISAVVGSGLAAGADAISATKVRRTLAAWAASFLIALAVTFAVVYVIPM